MVKLSRTTFDFSCAFFSFLDFLLLAGLSLFTAALTGAALPAAGRRAVVVFFAGVVLGLRAAVFSVMINSQADVVRAVYTATFCEVK
jgi:hypothetical protein